MAKRARLYGIEKFLNDNCFMVFLFLFMLTISYVMGIKNRKVKENLSNRRKRNMRTRFEKMKTKYNSRIENLENKINSSVRNSKRVTDDKIKNTKKAIHNVFNKFSFK